MRKEKRHVGIGLEQIIIHCPCCRFFVIGVSKMIAPINGLNKIRFLACFLNQYPQEIAKKL